jgi:hypothetical protein
MNRTLFYRRRSILLLVGAAAVCALGTGMPMRTRAATSPGADITGVFVDVSKIKDDSQSNGDTWDHIWAEDDAIYSFNCDGRGYGTHWKVTGADSIDGVMAVATA